MLVQEAVEAPQEIGEVFDTKQDLDKATFEAPAKIEEGDVQEAEKTQEQFTALVEAAAACGGTEDQKAEGREIWGPQKRRPTEDRKPETGK